MTLSPPVALGMLFPLGFVSPKTGLTLWMLALIASLLVSIWIIWVLNGRPDSGYHFGGYLFAPTIACLLLGQIGTFLLLGVALFLYFYERQPFLAGIVLLPCVWKPHLFLPFFIVLFLWSVSRKEYRIVAGFLAAVVASCALTLHFDPAGMVALSPDVDEHLCDLARICADTQRNRAFPHRPSCGLATVHSRSRSVPLGDMVLLDASQPLGLDGTGFLGAANLCGVFAVCLVLRRSHPAASCSLRRISGFALRSVSLAYRNLSLCRADRGVRLRPHCLEALSLDRPRVGWMVRLCDVEPRRTSTTNCQKGGSPH